MNVKTFFSTFLILLFILCKTETHQKQDSIKDYRKFAHIKTLIIEDGHPLFKNFGGIHHIYANEIALNAYKNKTNFPEDSIIVFDLLEVTKKDNTIGEGTRKILAYMKKTRNNPETGSWEFQAYLSGDFNKPIVKDPKNECFACHQSMEKKDYVFSEWRE